MAGRHDESVAPLVFVGGITMDAIAAVPHHPGPDERVIATTTVRAGGGPAATAAVAAARLGTRAVMLVAAVGDDEDGERTCAELSAEGVDISGVIRIPRARTGSSVIVVDVGRGTRAICATPGPPLNLDSSTAHSRCAIDAVRSARCVHVDHLGWAALTTVLDVRQQVGRPPVSADVSYGTPAFTPIGIDLYAPSLDEGIDPHRFLDEALSHGARCVVATRGAQGSTAACADGQRVSAPGASVDVVSTLGAGDVFHGAILAGLDRGLDLRRALIFANTVAALSCRGLDGRSAIPRPEAGLDPDALLEAITSQLTHAGVPQSSATT